MNRFDGSALTSADEARLGQQLAAVRRLMRDGRWRTPEQLEAALGYRWASISARLRDLRKKRWGGHKVERSCVGGGQFAYRLVLSDPQRSLF